MSRRRGRAAEPHPPSASELSPVPVPFQHGEFGMVQRARAPGCGTRARRQRAAFRRQQEASCRQIPARCGGRAAGAFHRCRIASVARRADAPHCLARSAAGRGRIQGNPALRNGVRWCCECGYASSGKGGGRHAHAASTRVKVVSSGFRSRSICAVNRHEAGYLREIAVSARREIPFSRATTGPLPARCCCAYLCYKDVPWQGHRFFREQGQRARCRRKLYVVLTAQNFHPAKARR